MANEARAESKLALNDRPTKATALGELERAREYARAGEPREAVAAIGRATGLAVMAALRQDGAVADYRMSTDTLLNQAVERGVIQNRHANLMLQFRDGALESMKVDLEEGRDPGKLEPDIEAARGLVHMLCGGRERNRELRAAAHEVSAKMGEALEEVRRMEPEPDIER